MYRRGAAALYPVVTANGALQIDGRLARLISPIGGVVSGLERLAPGLVRSADTVAMARLGEVSALREHPLRFGRELDGIGCHADPSVAARIAVLEALERYAAAVGDERRWLTGSAVDVGADGLDLSDAARCAPSELAAPDFPLTRWDRHRPLRWVRGWSLLDGRDVWVPAVMAHLGVAPAQPGERFWLQTSSGLAAGETEEKALLSACFELIERDAVAIGWLQRLALPRIDPADPAWHARGPQSDIHDGWGWSAVHSTWRADADRERIALFDATSDLGTPTALAVLPPAPGSTRPTLVGAGCSDSGSQAALKALRELTVVRAYTAGERPAGAPAHPHVPPEAFAHLFAAPTWRDVPRTGLAQEFIGTATQRLARTVRALSHTSRDVVAVDLTPVELEGAGVHVVRVVAPALIPYLAHPRVRYLASRRLYEAPPAMGFAALPPEEVNPWPSPLW